MTFGDWVYIEECQRRICFIHRKGGDAATYNLAEDAFFHTERIP